MYIEYEEDLIYKKMKQWLFFRLVNPNSKLVNVNDLKNTLKNNKLAVILK